MFSDVNNLMLHVNTALLETAYMVVLSLIISIILGGLLGLLLFVPPSTSCAPCLS